MRGIRIGIRQQVVSYCAGGRIASGQVNLGAERFSESLGKRRYLAFRSNIPNGPEIRIFLDVFVPSNQPSFVLPRSGDDDAISRVFVDLGKLNRGVKQDRTEWKASDSGGIQRQIKPMRQRSRKRQRIEKRDD